MSNHSDVTRSLNRLLIACREEGRALDTGAGLLLGPERAGLLHQSRRRGIFRRDLRASVVRLGGDPAKGGSPAAQLSGALWSLQILLGGAHTGDVYRACARAAERTAL